MSLATSNLNLGLNPGIITLREMDVINCLLAGKTAKETARALAISHRTVEKHLDNIKVKFSCRTKFELIAQLYQYGAN